MPRTPALHAGIAGNALLRAGLFGEASTARFERDVLEVPGVAAAIVLIGVNDIGFGALDGPAITTGQLIAGFRALLTAAREHEVLLLRNDHAVPEQHAAAVLERFG